MNEMDEMFQWAKSYVLYFSCLNFKRMKSKYLSALLSIAIASLLLSSCGSGGGNNQKIAKIRPEKIEINGDLSEYLQVVDNEYEIIDDFVGKLSIRVKAIQAMPLENQDSEIEITASILGENSMPISGTGEFVMNKSSMEKVSALLKKGVGEEIIELASDISQYDGSKHASKSKKFVVSGYFKSALGSNLNSEPADSEPGIYYSNEERVYFHNSPDESTRRNAFILKGEQVDITKIENGFGYTVFTSSENKTSSGWLKMSELSIAAAESNQETTSLDDEEPANNAGGQTADCDNFIKEYEAFVNSYIKLNKKYKANPTDVSILSDYTDAAQKAVDMQTQAGDCTDLKYAKKLLELSNKLSQVVH